jgi:hypothetical protein
MNFCKRYQADTDPEAAARKEQYIKGRRRWARKDLVSRDSLCTLETICCGFVFAGYQGLILSQKQKRRLKSSTEPAFLRLYPNLPAAALHIDAQSSEYSSSGGDSTDDEMVLSGRRDKWAEMRRQLDVAGEGVGDDSGSRAGARKGKGGWAVGVSEKILEVRTGRWRSWKVSCRLESLELAQ